MARCTSPGPGGYRCAGQLSHCLTSHQEGNGTWPLYGAERTALAIVERLQLQGDDRVRTYAATLEQLNREEEAREAAGATMGHWAAADAAVDQVLLGEHQLPEATEKALRHSVAEAIAAAEDAGRRDAGPTADQLLAQLHTQVGELQRQLDDAHRREQAAHGAAAVLQSQRAMTRAYLGDLLADHLGVTPPPETRVERNGQ